MRVPRRAWVAAFAVALAVVLMLAPTPAGPPPRADADAITERSRELATVRRAGRVEDLDSFVAEQEARVATDPDRGAEWRLLAEALLERCLVRDNRKGMAVGQPTHAELPAEHAADIAAALEALAHARQAGDDDHVELFRIEAAVRSLRITDWARALAERPAIAEALGKARELKPDHPRVLIALGCERLFAPRFLGHDPEGAKGMFLAAAEALPEDERPLVFAAMAAHLLEQPEEALALLARATERNPENRYATAVLERLRGAEPDPFGRDVE